MKAKYFALTPAVVLALFATTGCATKEYVQKENKAVHTRIDEVQGQVEKTQSRLDNTDKKVAEVSGQVNQVQSQVGQVQTQAGEASKTANEALERAKEAGKLAEGKLVYEKVLTDDKVHFSVSKHDLSKDAKTALDAFATELKKQNQGVYIEIQGHTDNVGSKKYNDELGLARAEAVRHYLNQEHKLPLHRMNAISYGAAEEVASNKTREGRAQNRRVALVVLR